MDGTSQRMCTYWLRALGREADSDIGPLTGGSQDAARRLAAREEAEDLADPPCGACAACLASRRSGAVRGVLAGLTWDPDGVSEEGGRLWVDLGRWPDLLSMADALDLLRDAGAGAVRLEPREDGASSGPRLVVWVVPEE
jgi:hypothetical protein